MLSTRFSCCSFRSDESRSLGSDALIAAVARATAEAVELDLALSGSISLGSGCGWGRAHYSVPERSVE